MQQVTEMMAPGEYLPVVTLSDEVALAINQIRIEASTLIGERHQLIEMDRLAEVPLPINALSTAEAVVLARGSEHYVERKKGLATDCLRLVKEWNHKLRSEVFGELRHQYNQPEEEFYSHGFAIGQMTLNALRPIKDNPEEEARRINERVEDRLPIIIKNIGGFALSSVGIRTISQCTDKAVEEYEDDMKHSRPHRGYDGYVPEIRKIMIRDIRIDPETGDRFQTQVGLAGNETITHEIIQIALRRKGLDASNLDKTSLHGTQLLVDDDLKDFVKLLDMVASEEWCTPIFMGERVSDDHPKDYDKFWNEAEQREIELMDMAETTASFLIDLVDDDFDPKHASAHVEEFVKRLLLGRAKKDITVAHTAFGEETAHSIQEVVRLEDLGRYEEAFDLMKKVEKAAPGGGYCSGGSCGLESVNLHSAEGKSLAEKLNAKPGDSIVKDKERGCKTCKQKTVVYAYNKNEVKKYCISCKASEQKKT